MTSNLYSSLQNKLVQKKQRKKIYKKHKNYIHKQPKVRSVKNSPKKIKNNPKIKSIYKLIYTSFELNAHLLTPFNLLILLSA